MDKSKRSNLKYISKKKGSYKPNKEKFKKNFGSLQQGHGLAYLQKDRVKRNYILQQKKEERKFKRNIEDEDTTTENTLTKDSYSESQYDREAFDALPSRKPKVSKFRKAKLEYENKIKERERLKREKEEKKEEIEEKRKKYKENKFLRYKKLNQKTTRGQPLMKARMELLLESVEKLVAK